MKLLFFDLETTGTNPARHGIHQISGIVEIDGVEQERFDFKVRPNPKAEILDEALAVGGVTREEIDAYPPMEEVYCKLVALLSRYVSKYNKADKFFLVGYNNASLITSSFVASSSKTAITTSARGFGRTPSTLWCWPRSTYSPSAI